MEGESHTLLTLFFSDVGSYWWICSQIWPFIYDYLTLFIDEFGQGVGLYDPYGPFHLEILHDSVIL